MVIDLSLIDCLEDSALLAQDDYLHLLYLHSAELLELG
jgi:hypothetical protein